MNGISENKNRLSITLLLSYGLFLILLSLLVTISSLSIRLFLICFFFLLPTVIAILKDKSEDKCLSLSVGLCNISGIMTYVPEIFLFYINDASQSFINSLPSITDIALVYSFSGIGLVLYMALPSVIMFLYLITRKNRKNVLKNKISLYEKKWDI